ncbi:hypothetical protein [Pseudomonas sp. CFBP 13727]|uniref:hypothetical protein n=1 Tax=Pseudomonas sp. CFBP 13727 TaxID=2775295 RepID=UPI0017848847|nr:hypothetical protein [Pseudomonas sp. CFBP 13727]MBD8621687.1 hypothetical protein [Pseudomonas sp. CFBP 13727]
MKKSHGPAFSVTELDLVKCTICRGRAFVAGIFSPRPCMQCNASGWVSADTGEALSLEVLVTQLGIRLQAAERQIEKLKRPVLMSGPAAQYEQNNRRGAGGTNYTGD